MSKIIPIFETVDIEVKIKDISFPIMGAMFLRRKNRYELISFDGRIKLTAENTEPTEALESFKALIGIAKKLKDFNENQEVFNYSNLLVMRFPSKKGAVNAIKEFLEKEKVEKIERILGETVTMPYFGVYLKQIGNEAKEIIDINIEASAKNPNEYWVKAHYVLKEQNGIEGVGRCIEEIIDKSKKIITFLEGEEK